MQTVQEKNKAVVRRFNEEFMVKGNMQAFEEIVAADFINHTTPPGFAADKNSIRDFVTGTLHQAMPGLTLEIFDMIAEGDKVFTHKAFTAVQQGDLLGQPATGKKTVLRIMDVIQLRDEKYIGHWSIRELKTIG